MEDPIASPVVVIRTLRDCGRLGGVEHIASGSPYFANAFTRDVGGEPPLEACLDAWDLVLLRTASTYWNVPGKYGPHGELFFFLVKKEPVASTDGPSNPFVSAETLKACALTGLHFLFLAAEGEAGSCGGPSPDSGGMWRHGCPMSLEWISSCSESDTSFGCEEYEHDDECQAIDVSGQDGQARWVAHFLEDWELGRVALSCHMAMDFLCQEMSDACWERSESLGSPCSL